MFNRCLHICYYILFNNRYRSKSGGGKSDGGGHMVNGHQGPPNGQQRSGTQVDRLAPLMFVSTPGMVNGGQDNHDPLREEENEAVRQQLRHTQDDLEEERRKTDWLYQAFLPPTTAAQIINGQRPDAGT